MAKNVGILAMEIYFPPSCIQQVKLKSFAVFKPFFILGFCLNIVRLTNVVEKKSKKLVGLISICCLFVQLCKVDPSGDLLWVSFSIFLDLSGKKWNLGTDHGTLLINFCC